MAVVRLFKKTVSICRYVDPSWSPQYKTVQPSIQAKPSLFADTAAAADPLSVACCHSVCTDVHLCSKFRLDLFCHFIFFCYLYFYSILSVFVLVLIPQLRQPNQTEFIFSASLMSVSVKHNFSEGVLILCCCFKCHVYWVVVETVFLCKLIRKWVSVSIHAKKKWGWQTGLCICVKFHEI